VAQLWIGAPNEEKEIMIWRYGICIDLDGWSDYIAKNLSQKYH